MSSIKKREQGFTLIEIVLVLAIAGLILLIVFLAVAGAQRSRRDAQRKNDAAAFVAAVETEASNANGALPASGNHVPSFKNAGPTGAYGLTDDTTTPVAWVNGAEHIAYTTTTICAGAKGTAVGATARNYSVVISLEAGGFACYDNH